jgi:hypothetical protein
MAALKFEMSRLLFLRHPTKTARLYIDEEAQARLAEAARRFEPNEVGSNLCARMQRFNNERW